MLKKKKLCRCFVDLEKVFDRVSRKVLEWALRKKGIPAVLVRSVVSLYGGVNTRVRVDSELLEIFEAKLGMHQRSMLSPFYFAVVVDVVTNVAREGALSESLYADELVLMSEAIEGLTNKFLEWKAAFVGKGLNVSLVKTTVIVCGGVTKVGMSNSEANPCGVCSLRVRADSVLCLQCGRWIQGRCDGMKSITPHFKEIIHAIM